jgi:threonylcarbamoyladenosine tRNA methylthiotransferase MtaB
MTKPAVPSPAVDVVSFGCRLNQYEGEIIAREVSRTDAEPTVVINTCAVTAEAERQARQAIRKVRRERPEARVVVTGCAAQINPGGYAAMAEVDLVVGNEEKLTAAAYRSATAALAPGQHAEIRVNDIQSIRATAGQWADDHQERARAFVQVQTGCDHRCTFCIIPYGRGPSRSVPIGVIVDHVRRLVMAGTREVVLTGVDITSYGGDLPGIPTLGQMVRRLLALVPELPRLRLSSLDAVEMDEDLWHLLGCEPRLMPHLHLSLQSGEDLILKRMKRRHLVTDAVTFCDRARSLRPDIVFGADLIAGFPTETEAQFATTMDTVARCGLTYLHVFPYSARPGTPAARMPQVAPAVRKRRAAELRACGESALARFLASQDGIEAECLVETPTRARSPHFAPVAITGGALGTLVRYRLRYCGGNQLEGTPVGLPATA